MVLHSGLDKEAEDCASGRGMIGLGVIHLALHSWRAVV